ncbi:MAG: DedA family protein [Candidatus Woesearchaeota archaeon]
MGILTLFGQLVDIILHMDKYLNIILHNYGTWTYAILFTVIFIETGLVLTPFLPGDSLLFVAGTLSGAGSLNVFVLFGLLSLAAVLGDTFNYWIGNYFGEKVFAQSRFFKKEYLQKTKKFYDSHGGKTIIIARFIPIVRTFAPFVAGIGQMSYLRFLTFNIVGGVGWVAIFIFGGYYFGQMVFVKQNLTLIIILIILTSFIPPALEYIKSKRR